MQPPTDERDAPDQQRDQERGRRREQQDKNADSLGVTLVSVLLGLSLSTFSVARQYLSDGVAVVVALVLVVALVGAIKIGGRDGWLKRMGRWLTS